MTIPIHVNNAQTTLGSAYTAGGNTLVMATGYGATLAAKLTALGLTLDASNPIRVTAIKSSALNTYGQITDLTKLAIFEATGRTGDTLTGVSVAEGTTDQNFAAGDTLAFLWTAGAAKELRDAIGAGSSGTVTSVALTVPTGLSVSGSPVTTSGTLAVTLGVSGILKGSGGSIVAASAGTDYATTLDHLTDVTLTTPAGGDLLAYNGGAWVNSSNYYTKTQVDTLISGVGGATALDDLSDVAITTPASGNVLSYNGSSWVNSAVPSHTHAASAITSGTIDAARLGSGTADNTTFLRGDQTWATVSGGGGTPGGSTGDVQYNDGGSFGGFWGFDGTTLTVDSGDRIAFTSTTGEFVRLGSVRFLHAGADTFNSSVYLGYGAGLVASTALETVAIGVEALANEASHSSNVAVGAYALQNSTNVSSTVALGRGALANLGTGGNAGIGCVGIGYNAMSSLTSGTSVIGIGAVFASATSVTASQGIGTSVCNASTSVASTVAIGRSALAAASTPDSNVVIGDFAMSAATTTAYGTTAIGYLAGSVPTSLSACTFVGGYAGGFSPVAATLSKSTCVGWNAQVTDSNMCALGGAGSDAVGVVVNGTTTTAQLQVNSSSGSKPSGRFKSGSTPSGNQFEWVDFGDTVQAFVSSAFIISARNGFKVTTTSGYYEGSNANNYMFWGGGGPNCQIIPINASHIGLCVKGFTSQTADLTQWQNSSSSVGFAVNKAGYPYLARTSAPADGDIAAGQAFLWFDSTNGAAKLKIKGKSADGTVVSGEVALA